MKQIIILNGDLDMSAGKAASQAAHASVGGMEEANWETRIIWKVFGRKKIVLKGTTKSMQRFLDDQGLIPFPIYPVRDAGLTELKKGTLTALGLPPMADSTADNWMEAAGFTELY